MSKLLPCPFCGGEAAIHNGGICKWVYCTNCGIDTPAALPDDEQLAVNFWNTRAERTCRMTDSYDGWYICSECNCQGQGDQWHVPPRYCPSCGARVVG